MTLNINPEFTTEWFQSILHQFGNMLSDISIFELENDIKAFYFSTPTELSTQLEVVVSETTKRHVAAFTCETIKSATIEYPTFKLVRTGNLARLYTGTQWTCIIISFSSEWVISYLGWITNHSQSVDISNQEFTNYLLTSSSPHIKHVFGLLSHFSLSTYPQPRKGCCFWLALLILEGIITFSKANKSKNYKIDPSDLNQILLIESRCFHLPSLPSIDLLAKQAGMSKTKFRTLFERIFNKPVYEHYQFIRMENARQMLLQGYSISEVSLKTGYTKRNNFSKAFKDHFGIIPSLLRKELV